MDYVFRKNDTTGLNMWMLLLLIIPIEVKTHEDGRNGDQNDEGRICELLQLLVGQTTTSRPVTTR
jgi:hypothetical protein